MPLAEISAALSATSNAIQLLKEINGTTKQVEINRVVLDMQAQLIDLSAKIIAIQAEYESLSKAKADLEKELVEERNKAEERSQYQLVSRGNGFAYRYSGTARPNHHLCATCFDSGVKSILFEFKSQIGPCCQCKRDEDHTFYP